MLLKKRSDTVRRSARIIPIQGYSRKLEGLYARHSAIEAVIQSLEDYDRFRAKRVEIIKQKTA